VCGRRSSSTPRALSIPHWGRRCGRPCPWHKSSAVRHPQHHPLPLYQPQQRVVPSFSLPVEIGTSLPSPSVLCFEIALPELAYGSIWLVSAGGDGDPHHLSPLAAYAFGTADAVLHDPGISPRILDLVTLFRYREAAAPEQAIERSIRLARDGWRVVHLVNGSTTASKYSTRLAEHGIPLRIASSTGEPVGGETPIGLLLLRQPVPVGGSEAGTMVMLFALSRCSWRQTRSEADVPMKGSMSQASFEFDREASPLGATGLGQLTAVSAAPAIATRSITSSASGCAICRSPRRNCCEVHGVWQRWGIFASKPSPQSRGKVDKVSLLLPSVVLNGGVDEAIEPRRDDYAGPFVRQPRRWRGPLTPAGGGLAGLPRRQGGWWRNRHSATHEPNLAYVSMLKGSARGQVTLSARSQLG
jgi:hypothetical protein